MLVSECSLVFSRVYFFACLIVFGFTFKIIVYNILDVQLRNNVILFRGKLA